jgi:hypothetical protein
MLTLLIVQCFFFILHFSGVFRVTFHAHCKQNVSKKFVFKIFIVHAYMFSTATYCFNLVFLWCRLRYVVFFTDLKNIALCRMEYRNFLN